MKLSDLILSNYKLLSVFNRFDINLGFGEKTIFDICSQKQITPEFFILVCNIYSFEDYLPNNKNLLDINPKDLINFLRKTHYYFLKESLSEIENDLDELCEHCEDNHLVILKKFFIDYRKEVINHFEYEENIVFPYIENINKLGFNTDYNIHIFEDNHSNIEDKLSDLKNIIIKYLPETCSSKKRSILLEKLFCFQDELIIHSRIEEKILIPLVSEIEKHIND